MRSWRAASKGEVRHHPTVFVSRASYPHARKCRGSRSLTLRIMDHYANAIRARPGHCWRMVSRGPGFRMGSPTDCLDPVRWTGWTMVGKKRLRLWSCEGQVQGLEDLRAERRSIGARPDVSGQQQ
jgi:hypothetical protein